MTISPFDALHSMPSEFDIFEDVCFWSKLLFEKELTPSVILADDIPVWGFALMRQARETGIPVLSCRKISSKSKIELLFIALALENRGGTYTWKERLNIYELCKTNSIAISDELIYSIEAGRFNDWEQKVQQYAGFTNPLQILVQEKMVDLKTARQITSLPEACFSLMYEKKEKLSHSERRMFLEQLHAVMMRDNMDAEKSIALCEELLAEASPMKKLESLRFPELVRMQNEFYQYAQTLRKKGITLSEPPYFEGEAFTVQFPFVSQVNYEKKLKALADFKGQVNELFELL